MPSTKQALARIVGSATKTLLVLLVLPLLSLGIASIGSAKLDDEFLPAIEKSVDAQPGHSASERAETKAFYRAHPPSSMCTNDDPQLAPYRQGVCEFGSGLWQMHRAAQTSWFALFLTGGAFVAALLLTAVAFRGRRGQYVSLFIGTRLFKVVAVVQTVIHGALLVWLSFWVTALFMHVYALKLIGIAALVALFGVGAAIKSILAKPPARAALEAETLSEADAPGLWKRIGDLAARLGTAPPQHVVAGIDDNFFVTEAGITVGERELHGRALYVSLPLLRLLEASEADAVLAHELAHFHGGDTAANAKLGPLLVAYDVYLAHIGQGFAFTAKLLMSMFRGLFELARQAETRRRELLADETAARLTSADDVARSLLKTAAYSSYRGNVEQTLFDRDEKHEGDLGIAERIRSGLHAHVGTAAFKQALEVREIPHPFDSHPPLEERLANVGTRYRAAHVDALVELEPKTTWVDDIAVARSIEERLWKAYEDKFAALHELSLAYRYAPKTDAERVLVEKFFPPMSFSLKDGKPATLSCETLSIPGMESVPLSDIEQLRRDEGNFTDTLILSHRPGCRNGITKIKLNDFTDRNAFLEALGKYAQRAAAAYAYEREVRPVSARAA